MDTSYAMLIICYCDVFIWYCNECSVLLSCWGSILLVKQAEQKSCPLFYLYNKPYIYHWKFLYREIAIARLLYTTLPPFLHILYLTANMCVAVWLLLSRQFSAQPWIGLIPLSAGAVLIHLVLVLMLRAHRAACPRLRNVAYRDYWVTRALAHNGVAVHGVSVTAMLLYQVSLWE